MNVDCQKVKSLVQAFSLVKDCDQLADGTLRIATPFSYPDTSNIDVFISETHEGFELSDLGQTTAYLLDAHMKPWTTKKRKQIVTDVCSGLNIQNDGGELKIKFSAGKINDISTMIVRLTQACRSISGMAFTQRLRTTSSLHDEFEEFLSSAELDVTPNVPILGHNEEITIDFVVKGQLRSSLVQTLFSENVTSAHNLATDTFAKWWDLTDRQGPKYQFVSIYNSTNDAFKKSDIQRMEQISTVLSYPAQEKDIKLVLAA